MYWSLLFLGGIFNLYRFHKMGVSMRYPVYGYVTAFIMGALIFGGMMSFFLWLIS